MSAPTIEQQPDDADTSRVGTLLERTIRDIGIPPRPAILDSIHAETDKDEPDFKRLSALIGSDVSLAAGLIAIANSPFFGARTRVRSVKDALLMLGLRVASRAVAGLILRKVLPQAPSLQRFWDSSASIARLSGWLAQRPDGPRIAADDAYTFGLFRDCGIPILMRRFPNYGDVLARANQATTQSFSAVEDAECPTNHAKVGCLLAQSWWLPDEICLAIRHHHDFDFLLTGRGAALPSATPGLIAIAHLAEHLVQHHTGLCHTEEWLKWQADCLHILGIGDAELDSIYTASQPIVAAGE